MGGRRVDEGRSRGVVGSSAFSMVLGLVLAVVGVVVGTGSLISRRWTWLVGVLALVAFVGGLAGLWLRRPSIAWVSSGGALVTALILVVVSSGHEMTPAGATEPNSPLPSQTLEAPSAAPPAGPSRTPVSLATPVYDEGCPAPTGDAIPRAVLIRVIYWCFGNVLTESGDLVETQRQVKVRLGITNTCDHEISISTQNPSRVRLLVAGDNIDQRWAPNAKTLSAGDRPVQVVLNGVGYWAIPPNAPWSESLADGGMYTGFASKWKEPSMLPPGAAVGGSAEISTNGTTYTGAGVDSDLVFQVPADGYDEPLNMVGVAVLDIPDGSTDPADWTVLGLEQVADWQTQLEPALF